MPSRLTDAAWLRRQVEAHRTARSIAAELGVTDRAGRIAIRRHGIERPPRQDLIDRALAEYRAGSRIADIAAIVHRTPRWVHLQVQQAGAERPLGHRRRSPRHNVLDDGAWLKAQLDAGGSVRSIARTLNADRHTVRIAIGRHDLDRCSGSSRTPEAPTTRGRADSRPLRHSHERSGLVGWPELLQRESL